MVPLQPTIAATRSQTCAFDLNEEQGLGTLSIIVASKGSDRRVGLDAAREYDVALLRVPGWRKLLTKSNFVDCLLAVPRYLYRKLPSVLTRLDGKMGHSFARLCNPRPLVTSFAAKGSVADDARTSKPERRPARLALRSGRDRPHARFGTQTLVAILPQMRRLDLALV